MSETFTKQPVTKKSRYDTEDVIKQQLFLESDGAVTSGQFAYRS
jgi:hypothetical protein